MKRLITDCFKLMTVRSNANAQGQPHASPRGFHSAVFHSTGMSLPCETLHQLDTLESRLLLSATPGTEQLVNQDTLLYQSRASVAVNDLGQSVVVWEQVDPQTEDVDIYMRRYDSSGQANGDAVQVNALDGYQWSPDVAMDNAGNIFIVWAGDGLRDLDIFLRRFDASGSPIDEVELLVNDLDGEGDGDPGDQVGARVAVSNTGYGVVVWEDTQSNQVQMYATTAALDANPGEYEFDVAGEFGYSPDVDIDDAGFITVVAAFDDGQTSGIIGRQFKLPSAPGATDAAVGITHLIHTAAGQIADHPSVERLNSNGDAVVIWQRYGMDQPAAIEYRQFNSGSGQPLSDVILVAEGFDVANPDIAQGPHGSIITVYDDFSAVMVDQWDRSTHTRLVETHIANDDDSAMAPRIASAAGGSFTVVWEGSNMDPDENLNDEWGILRRDYVAGTQTDTTGPTSDSWFIPQLTEATSEPHRIYIDYYDPEDGEGIDFDSLDGDEISVMNQFEHLLNVSLVQVTTNEGVYSAVYEIDPFGGEWGPEDNGTYIVHWHADTLFDLAGNSNDDLQLSNLVVNITSDTTPPLVADHDLPDRTHPGSDSLILTVEFTDTATTDGAPVSGIDPATINGDELVVSAQSDVFLAVSLHSLTELSPGHYVAQYAVLPADGDWGPEDMGLYEVYINPGSFADHAGNSIPDFDYIGDFTVAFATNDPPSIEVINHESGSVEGETFTFSALAGDPEEQPLLYEWDFGDGSDPVSGVELANINHVFTDNGTYTVTLTVTDDNEQTTTDTAEVVVTNAAPVILASEVSPSQLDVGQNGQFTVSFTDAGSDDTHTVTWDFGDDTAAVEGNNVLHSFSSSGTYTVIVQVVDDDGGSVFDTFEVDVTQTALEFTEVNIPEQLGEGEEGTFSATAQLVAGTEILPGENIIYHWDFGNGQSAVGQVVQFTFANDGAYLVTVTATDEDGNFVTTDMMVDVFNRNPLIDHLIAPIAMVQGESALFEAQASDPGVEDVLIYEWDFGDGSATQFGQAVMHTYNGPGIFSVTLLVTDGDNGQVIAERTVNVAAGDGGFGEETDNAGDRPINALDLGFLQGQETRSGTVGGTAGNAESGFKLDERDVYIFRLSRTARVHITLTNLTGDVNIILKDAKGRTVARGINKGLEDESFTRRLKAGMYYVHVIPVGQQVSTTQLKLTADFAGHNRKTALHLKQIERGGHALREFTGSGPAADHADYYRIRITSQSDLYLRIDSDEAAMPNITLRDQKHRLITRATDMGDGTQLIATRVKPGTYFVRIIRGRNLELEQQSGELGSVGTPVIFNDGGNYNMHAIVLRDRAGHDLQRAFNHLPLSWNVTRGIREMVGGIDSVDLHRLNITQAGHLVARIFDMQGNLDLQLLDTVGNVIASSANDATADEILSRFITPGTYYAKVHRLNESEASPYVFNVTLTEALPG